MMSHHPEIPKNRHHIAAWMVAVERRRDPDKTLIDHLFWFQESTDEEIVFLHHVSTYLAGVEYAGAPPVFLTENYDEPGSGLFHLTAPCVLVRWGRTRAGRRLNLEVIVVARRQDYDRVRGTGIALPEPGLVLPTVSRMLHLPKRDQRSIGQPQHPEPQPDPNGGDSNAHS